jgi:hypothetical protein
MDNQSSIRPSSLAFTPRGNLGHDFITIVAGIEGVSLRDKRDLMKPSRAPDNSRHEFRRFNPYLAVLLQEEAIFVYD